MPLDVAAAFKALANAARRDIISRLAYGPANTSSLAEPLQMTLAGATQHLQHLEAASLVVSAKSGRTRIYRLNAEAFEELELWLAGRRNRWETQVSRLETHLQKIEKGNIT